MEHNAGRRSSRRLGSVALAGLAVLALLVGLGGCGRSDPPTLAVGSAPEVDVVLVDPGGALPAVACDWDGDGVDTPATFDGGRWMVRDADGASSYVGSLLFGQAPGDLPVCGDWDGDGDDEPGVFRAGTFLLRSDLGAMATTAEVAAGPGIPVAGDWDGDGLDTIGLYAEGLWTLTDDPGGRNGPTTLRFGAIAHDRPVVGDWDGDGDDTIGIVQGSTWRTSDLPRSADSFTVTGDGVVTGVALAVGAGAGEPDRPTVVRHRPGVADPIDIHVFGDSLAVESEDAFLAAMATGRARPVDVTYAAWGGTAICDYLEGIAAAPAEGAEAIVLAFSGNRITDCTLLDPGEGTCPGDTPLETRAHLLECRREGDDLHRQYLDDARRAVASVAPTPVLLVAPPTMADPERGLNPRPGTGQQGNVWRAYRQVAAEHAHVTLVDGGRWLTPDDRWVEEAPCLPGEECSPRTAPAPGEPLMAVVRAPDGTHLCDPRFDDRRSEGSVCTPLLPGAHRFGGAIADAVATLFDL